MFQGLDQQFLGGIVNAVDRIASSVLTDMLSKSPTKDTTRAMKIAQNATVMGDQIKAVIEIDLGIAPEAVAYEFGSGVHGEKGKEYPIVPKNKKFLAFEWDKADPSIHMMVNYKGKNLVLFKKVMHPGVEARPFIKPALENALKNLPDLLGREIIKAVKQTSIEI